MGDDVPGAPETLPGGANDARKTNPRTPTTVTKKGDDGLEAETKELSFDEFLEMVIHMRPENNASIMDICTLRKMVRSMSRRITKRIKRTTKVLKADDKKGSTRPMASS